MNTKIFFAYAIIWVAVSAAIIAGLLITQNANCLWAFLIPALISSKFENNNNEKNNDDMEKDI